MAMADVNEKTLVIIFLTMTFCGGVYAASDDPVLLNIGLSGEGWISNFGLDYKFDLHVGDSVMFCYEGLVHDVREVTQKDYDSCNGVNPIATYNNGGPGTFCDIITFQSAGHHYFICGHPGHCEAGQKMDVFVKPGPPIPSTNPAAANY